MIDADIPDDETFSRPRILPNLIIGLSIWAIAILVAVEVLCS